MSYKEDINFCIKKILSILLTIGIIISGIKIENVVYAGDNNEEFNNSTSEPQDFFEITINELETTIANSPVISNINIVPITAQAPIGNIAMPLRMRIARYNPLRYISLRREELRVVSPTESLSDYDYSLSSTTENSINLTVVNENNEGSSEGACEGLFAVLEIVFAVGLCGLVGFLFYRITS